MTHHIIIEGPDGSGKTQLIADLVGERVARTERVGALTADVLHGGIPYEFYLGKLIDATPAAYDRFYLSELIYGPMLRERSAIRREEIATIRGGNFRTETIVCLPSEPVCYLATRSRAWPEYQTDGFLARAYRAWAEIANSDLVDFIYDWTRPPGERLRPSRGIPVGLAAFR